jgi:hypothetical protein
VLHLTLKYSKQGASYSLLAILAYNPLAGNEELHNIEKRGRGKEETEDSRDGTRGRERPDTWADTEERRAQCHEEDANQEEKVQDAHGKRAIEECKGQNDSPKSQQCSDNSKNRKPDEGKIVERTRK